MGSRPVNLGFLGLSVLELGQGMQQTDGQTKRWTDRQTPAIKDGA